MIPPMAHLHLRHCKMWSLSCFGNTFIIIIIIIILSIYFQYKNKLLL